MSLDSKTQHGGQANKFQGYFLKKRRAFSFTFLGVSKIARNKMPLWESSLDEYSEKRKEKKVHAERK